jgi:hypothetical protein
MARKIVASHLIANPAEARHHGFPDVVVRVNVRVRSIHRVDPVKVHYTGPNAFSCARWRVFNDTGFFLLHHGVRPTVRLLSRHPAIQHILEDPTDGLEIDLHLPTPPVLTVAIKLIVSHDPIVPLGTNLPNIAHPIQGLMPTARASRHGVKLVHVPTPGQLARTVRRLNRAVVADTTVLKCFVSSRAVLLSKERSKECAIDLAQALGQEALIGVCRRDLP